MFIGQTKIWEEVDGLISAMKNGTNLNILLSAPSGWGKSRMAIIIGNEVAPDSLFYDLPDDSGNIYLPDIIKYSVVVIDEIHTLKQPERLYPLLDKRDRNFILCTNESGVLKEPLVNRCINFIFDDYSEAEIAAIVNHNLNALGIEFPVSFVRRIAENSNGNPRIAKQVVERLSYVFKKKGTPETEEDLLKIIQEILQIRQGLNIYHERYLTFLRKVKVSTLSRISFSLHIDPGFIQREIEPELVKRGLIEITSKGRKICEK